MPERAPPLAERPGKNDRPLQRFGCVLILRAKRRECERSASRPGLAAAVYAKERSNRSTRHMQSDVLRAPGQLALRRQGQNAPTGAGFDIEIGQVSPNRFTYMDMQKLTSFGLTVSLLLSLIAGSASRA